MLTLRGKEQYRAIQALQRAIKKFQSYPTGSLIPKVESNLGFALPSAKSAEDVIPLFQAGLFALKTASMSFLLLNLEAQDVAISF